MFPTDRLDTSDPAAVRAYAAHYLVHIIGQLRVFGLASTWLRLVGGLH
jgi:hypothetical protein